MTAAAVLIRRPTGKQRTGADRVAVRQESMLHESGMNGDAADSGFRLRGGHVEEPNTRLFADVLRVKVANLAFPHSAKERDRHDPRERRFQIVLVRLYLVSQT